VIALVFSALFTVYLLVPEAIFRLIFGLFIPPRAFVLTRIEKAYRAVLITILPFLIAWGLSWYAPGYGPQNFPFRVTQDSVQQRRSDYKIVAAAFYSDTEFAKEGNQFWPAATRCARRQARLVFWYLSFVGLEALCMGLVAANYPKLENPILKWISNWFLSTYISQWHPLLPKGGSDIVQVDILCSNEGLYQGELVDYFLKDGELSGIILQNPRRFDRPRYIKAKEEAEKKAEAKPVEPKDYWRKIPSESLYFFADKILNINLTYLNPKSVKTFLAQEFQNIQLKVSVRERPPDKLSEKPPEKPPEKT
jgi:hypothetical protein